MFFFSSVCLLIYYFVQINCQGSNNGPSTYTVKCESLTKAKDFVYDPTNISLPERHKRFVLFPEFVNFRDNWNYINAPPLFNYWLANFYQKVLSNETLAYYIEHIIKQINEVLDTDIVITQAIDPPDANFQFSLFDYTICPDKDANATTDGVLSFDKLDVYTPEVVRKSRYRAHGGIHLLPDNRSRSIIKLNMQHTFLLADDFVYDPITYTCISDEVNICDIDLYYVLLHETLHGFGIEVMNTTEYICLMFFFQHTSNPEVPKPNENMKSVMLNTYTRILCHDDIRALRYIYNQTYTRDNAQYDDTCRRDFPPDFWQKLMKLITKWLSICSLILLVVSSVTFILTIIYLLLRKFVPKRQSSPKTSAKKTNKPHGYLWHQDTI